MPTPLTKERKTMAAESLNAVDALRIVREFAQRMRENGESDMRSIIYACSSITAAVQAGKPRDLIIAEWADEEDEDDDQAL